MRNIFTGFCALLAGFACLTANAQVATNQAARTLTLEECVQMALEHNLSLQLERLNPRIARLTLDGSYAPWDPAFNFRGQQNFVSSPGGFNPNILLTTPPNETWTEQFSTGLGGNTPTGMRYDVSASTTRTSGRVPSFDTNTMSFLYVDRPYQYRSDVGISFTQPLLKNFWTDATRTQIKVNKKQIQITELGFEFQVMTIVRAVQQTYFDLIATRENVRVQQLALELAQRLVAENRRKVEIGTLAELDEKQAESQAAEAQASLIEATNLVFQAENALKRLFSDNFAHWQRTKLEPSEKLSDAPVIFNLGDSWTSALELRPDYNQLKHEIEKQNINLKFRYNQLFPELDLIGSYGRGGLGGSFDNSLEAIGSDDNPRWGGGGMLTFPLTRKSERSSYKIAKEQVQQALLLLKQKEQDIIVDIDNAVKTAQSSFQRVQATHQARIFAELALAAEKKKLDSGKSTSFIVLSLQRDLTGAQVNEIRALVDYNKALSDLYYKEGTNLRRSRVAIQFK